jgi:hypothetical protein
LYTLRNTKIKLLHNDILMIYAKKVIMGKFAQNDESKRFLRVLDELIHLQLVKNDSDFCKRECYSPQSLSQVRRAKRDITTELIGRIFRNYLGNPFFIFGGEGELILSGGPTSNAGDAELAYRNRFEERKLTRQIERLTNVLESYAKQAEMNVKYVKLLEDQLAEYKAKEQS